jgi:hypothetical protein
LLYHPESDSLFEVFSQRELEEAFNAGADGALLIDVTGIRWAEYAFKHGLVPNPPGNLMEDE